MSTCYCHPPSERERQRRAASDRRRVCVTGPIGPPVAQRRTPRPSRTGRISRRRRTTSRPDTRTLWCVVGRARRRRQLGTKVPICLGDHVHVWVSPFASRLGCPVSSGLKMKAPAFSHVTPAFGTKRKSAIFFFKLPYSGHIRQVQTLTADHLVLVLYSVQLIVLSTIPVQWL